MKENRYVWLLMSILAPGCFGSKKTVMHPPAGKTIQVISDSLDVFDKTRRRAVPVALYLPKPGRAITHEKLIIFSHGYYGGASSGPHREYTYLTGRLASEGYFVASIRHELPTDSLMPSTGVPQVVRRPFWERGSDNILFVLNELKKLYPGLDYKHVVLIGHSNGGDITALFATRHPALADKIITLDNRRMALPHTRHPAVYSLRSADQPADEDVLPGPDEQEKYGMTIVKLPAIKHNDMDNRGSDAQHREINQYIACFLNDR